MIRQKKTCLLREAQSEVILFALRSSIAPRKMVKFSVTSQDMRVTDSTQAKVITIVIIHVYVISYKINGDGLCLHPLAVHEQASPKEEPPARAPTVLQDGWPQSSSHFPPC